MRITRALAYLPNDIQMVVDSFWTIEDFELWFRWHTSTHPRHWTHSNSWWCTGTVQNANDRVFNTLFESWEQRIASQTRNPIVSFLRDCGWTYLNPDKFDHQRLEEAAVRNLGLTEEEEDRLYNQYITDSGTTEIRGSHYASTDLIVFVPQDAESWYEDAGIPPDIQLGYNEPTNTNISTEDGKTICPGHRYGFMGFANQHLRSIDGRVMEPLSWRFTVVPVFYARKDPTVGFVVEHRLNEPANRVVRAGTSVTPLSAIGFTSLQEDTVPVNEIAWIANADRHLYEMSEIALYLSQALMVSVHIGIEESRLKGEQPYYRYHEACDGIHHLVIPTFARGLWGRLKIQHVSLHNGRFAPGKPELDDGSPILVDAPEGFVRGSSQDFLYI